jgi:hypothetical protein
MTDQTYTVPKTHVIAALLIALATDPIRLEEYEKDSVDVMRRAGLTEDQILAVLSGDQHTITRALSAEMQRQKVIMSEVEALLS